MRKTYVEQPFSHLSVTAPLAQGSLIAVSPLETLSPASRELSHRASLIVRLPSAAAPWHRPTGFCVFLVGVDVPGDPRSAMFCFLSGYACFMLLLWFDNYSFLQSKGRSFSGRRGRRPLQGWSFVRLEFVVFCPLTRFAGALP